MGDSHSHERHPRDQGGVKLPRYEVWAEPLTPFTVPSPDTTLVPEGVLRFVEVEAVAELQKAVSSSSDEVREALQATSTSLAEQLIQLAVGVTDPGYQVAFAMWVSLLLAYFGGVLRRRGRPLG